jgi:hypothetical protein
MLATGDQWLAAETRSVVDVVILDASVCAFAGCTPTSCLHVP